MTEETETRLRREFAGQIMASMMAHGQTEQTVDQAMPHVTALLAVKGANALIVALKLQETR